MNIRKFALAFGIFFVVSQPSHASLGKHAERLDVYSRSEISTPMSGKKMDVDSSIDLFMNIGINPEYTAFSEESPSGEVPKIPSQDNCKVVLPGISFCF